MNDERVFEIGDYVVIDPEWDEWLRGGYQEEVLSKIQLAGAVGTVKHAFRRRGGQLLDVEFQWERPLIPGGEIALVPVRSMFTCDQLRHFENFDTDGVK